MAIFISVISLLGGLAMFLYGMEVMGDGLKSASGSTLKKVLEKVTSNVLVGAIMGTLVTAVIQSSTATIVITVGLLTAGVLNLKQSISIVLGANIGTTITAQMVRLMDIDSTGNAILEFFKPSTLAPLALVIGIILIMFVKKNNSKNIGDICAGFGILFMGIMNMSAAVEPLTQSPAFANIIEKFSDLPVLGILTGFVTTVIAQSSSATVGMLQAMSSTGVMTFNVIYPIIMGINIGTCVTTAIVCSIGSSKDAKRTGVAHIAFNVIGTVFFMIVIEIVKALGFFPELWEKTASSGLIADFQTVFNLITAVVLLPFAGLLVKLTYVVVKPDKEEKEEKYPELRTLSTKLYELPHVAISEASAAIAGMGRLAHENFKKSIGHMTSFDESTSIEINEREKVIDGFTDTVENFLVGLSQNILTDEENEVVNLLIQTSTNFERIGDYATNINEFAEKIKKNQVTFSPIATSQLDILLSAVDDIIDMTVTAFEKHDEELARCIEPLEEVIDDMVQYLSDNHINRLKTGDCVPASGIYFMETLTYLERASDQCSSTAMLLLSIHDPEIRKNHHEYIHKLHKEKQGAYAEEIAARRKQYLAPLMSLK
ncbi:MAG: Na/Pi cotransporter family protein [Clostridia bacterium]|nr:Na/Pi cotransporter family protein [Clostridia bacterium]